MRETKFGGSDEDGKIFQKAKEKLEVGRRKGDGIREGRWGKVGRRARGSD